MFKKRLRELDEAMDRLTIKTGRTFFVMSSTAKGYEKFNRDHEAYSDGVEKVYTDIESANSACVANRGDVVYVNEEYTKTISNATSINLDVAGVEIIGLGAGNKRPTITFDTATTTTIPVSAADVKISGIIFTANFADIVSVFTLTTANNFTLEDCYIKATATNMNFLYVVDTDATTSHADGLTIEGCKWIEPDTATLSMVKMDGDNYDVKIINNFVQIGVNNNKAALMAIITGKSVFNAQITDNRVFRLNTDTATGGILVTTDQSDNSGIIANNFAQHADIAAEILVTASSGFGFFNNYASGVAGASGYILPGVDS